MSYVAPMPATCVACGSPLGAGEQFCSCCGSPRPKAESATPESSAGRTAEAIPPEIHSDTQKGHTPPEFSLQCNNCGATILNQQAARSVQCPFCDASIVVELSPKAGRRPEFILGFALAPDTAKELFFKWVRSGGWFCPADLKQKAQTEDQRGVYVPFWHFSALASSNWTAEIGEHWYRTETYTTRDSKGKTVRRTRRVLETEWFPLSGVYETYQFGHLVPATRGLSNHELTSVSPFKLAALVRYSPDQIAGWPVEEPSISDDEARQKGDAHYQNQQNGQVAKFMPGDAQRSLSIRTKVEPTGTDLVLLPIYIWRYHYRGKTFRFIINGQTGKVFGVKPISRWRVAMAVCVPLLILALVFVLVQLLG